MSLVASADLTGEREVVYLRTLYGLLAALTRAKSLDDVYAAAIGGLLEATAADRAAIVVFDEEGSPRFKAWQNLSDAYRQAVSGHTPWAIGTRDAKSIVVRDVLLDPDLQEFQEQLSREGIRALVFVPLALKAGVMGKCMLYYSEPHECKPDELAIAEAIAGHVAIATERKRAETARIQSEQRLLAILDNSSTVIFLKDLQGRYILVNRRFEELFGLSKADAAGKTDRQIFSPEVAERFQENDRKAIEHGGPLAVEEYAPHSDGMHTYISVKFPIPGPAGEVSGVCGIATDITDRKQLEAASQRLAAIVESSDDAIVGKDLNGIITSWNRGAERILGYTAEEAIGRPVSMLAAPDRVDEMPEMLRQIRMGRRLEHYETRRRRKDGGIIDVSLTISPVRDVSGKLIGASKIARDITDQKIAQTERASLLAREQESRRRAELLYRIGPRLVAELDLEKLVQIVTDTATALVGAEFGVLFHNLVKEQGEAVAGFPMPRDTPILARTFRGEGVVRLDDVTQDPLYANNQPDPGVREGHLPVRSYLAAPVVSRSGEVLGGLFLGHSKPGIFTAAHEEIVKGIAAQAAVAMDNARLFEQSEWAQAELKRSNEELRRANQDLETFAYSASHDLQEPLRTIAISAQLLERNCGNQLRADDSNFLANILASANRMSNLIQDLLAYTRATKYEEGLPPSVDSGAVLAGVVEYLKAMIEESGATVTSADLPRVCIHETRLSQLFQNLISNAVKYRAKEVPRVHVSAAQKDGWCVFSVADNGIGIEPQYAEQIFKLFTRLHGRDEYPGSGIGLAICQRIVEQYGGRIWLEKSVPGEGSTFSFAIPAGTR